MSKPQPVQVTSDDFKATVAQWLGMKELAIIERDLVIKGLREQLAKLTEAQAK